MRQKIVEIPPGNSPPKHPFFACSKNLYCYISPERRTFIREDDSRCSRVWGRWRSCEYAETALFVAYTHLPLVQVFADQHSKLIIRNASGPPRAHEVHSVVRPASGPCRTAHGQNVRRGESLTSLGEWDMRGTELDLGVSVAK